MRAFFLVFLLACLMQGCGQKGGLYLPTAEQLQEEEERIRALAARERREAEALERERRVAPALPEQSAPAPTQPTAQ